MNTSAITETAATAPLEWSTLSRLPFASFRNTLFEATRGGVRLSALFAQPDDNGSIDLCAVLSDPRTGSISVSRTSIGDSYGALTPECPQAHWFEREIAEQWGIVPEGHPWLKPVRFHHSYRPGHDAWGRTAASDIPPSVTDFFRIEGAEVHEVAVGPVHAGVIEPGHFRFQCHGEIVFTLEISLGFQHRGVERALVGGPNKRTLHYMETLAGDTSIGHATAYCQVLEALSGTTVPPRGESIRAIALELERLANHTGDLGALANDVGYLPTAAYCGRLRGDFLNATGAICGNRFGRSLVKPGGVRFDVGPEMRDDLILKLTNALRDVDGAVGLLWESPSVQARFERVGTVSRDDCLALGLVGPAARACGVDYDVRRDFPSGAYRATPFPVSTAGTGDVNARALMRWLEIRRSCEFVLEQLASLPAGPLSVPLQTLRSDAVAVSLVEGWRGEICHVGITDAEGRFVRYKVVDPSFHNWVGLMMALRNQEISDFPLCNKSFNLSYCGHDL
ncbi:MAG TPA: NADH-quinone oxidoreductase subunit C, partial [Planctomycetaceae bacterium]|nr:NADH-quinone oxidoreductase subunit C [Planctomycetaceae bacterium]